MPVFSATGLMGWILGLNYLLGWGRLPLFGRYGCVKMITCLMIKQLFSYAVYLPVQWFAPFMVVSSAYGELRPLYGGVYMVEGHGEGVYYPIWMTA
jgi:hypothetical protein